MPLSSAVADCWDILSRKVAALAKVPHSDMTQAQNLNTKNSSVESSVAKMSVGKKHTYLSDTQGI